MNIYIFALSVAFLILGFSSPSYAQLGKVVQCGIPQNVSIERDPAYDFCDVYTRQLEYREKRQDLRADIDARRVNFAAPGVAARNAYLEAIKEDYTARDRVKVKANEEKEVLVAPKEEIAMSVEGAVVDDLNDAQFAKLTESLSE